jgi:D-proline reductase (dithiol) PrdB
MNIIRLKNRALSKLLSVFPPLARHFIDSYSPLESTDIPWSPVKLPLHKSRLALITTSGVHHRDQKPFDMNDKTGDPSFRTIDSSCNVSDLMITHDYYDHSDAEKDINIVFPIERLRELRQRRVIGELAHSHYAFMGHISEGHIHTLVNNSAPEVIEKLEQDNVDAVLLTPA